MEPIQHTSHERRKRNTTKSNLVISIVVHALMFAAIAFWAAHEGLVGKELQKLTVTLVGKEKKAEPEKRAEEKPAEAKTVPESKPAETRRAASAPPLRGDIPPAAPPVAAPPPASVPAFSIGSELGTGTDAQVDVYKRYVESVIRARWERPVDVDDQPFVVEINVQIDAAGNLTQSEWLRGSGHGRWDDSVRSALAATKAIGRSPPKGFPSKVMIRFDTVSESESLTVQ